MALAGLAAGLVHLLPEPLRQYLSDHAGLFSDAMQSSASSFSHGTEWTGHEQHSGSFVPQWFHLVLLAAMVIPLIYMFFPKKPKVFLNPNEWQDLALVSKEAVSHNVRRFRFALPQKDMVLGLPVGAHISFKAADPDGKVVLRPYTPVSDDNLCGYVDFVIKLYPQGKMSQCLERLSLGDRLAFKGPRGRLTYKPNMKKAIGMVAGGSGITPMFQVASAILRNPRDATKVFLVYANVAEGDILLREQLDAWARTERARFRVYYVLEKPPAGWAMGTGFVNAAILREHLPPPSEGALVLRCGPPGMNRAVEGILDAAGYSKDMQFEF